MMVAKGDAADRHLLYRRFRLAYDKGRHIRPSKGRSAPVIRPKTAPRPQVADSSGVISAPQPRPRPHEVIPKKVDRFSTTGVPGGSACALSHSPACTVADEDLRIRLGFSEVQQTEVSP